MTPSNSKLKFRYQVKNRIGLFNNSKFTPYLMITIYTALTVAQLILFALGRQSLVGITNTSSDAWKGYATYSTGLVGTVFMIFAATKLAQGRKDFFVWRMMAVTIFMVNNIFINLYISFFKLVAVTFMTLFQHYKWGQDKGPVVKPESMDPYYFFPLLALMMTAGVVLGWGQTTLNTGKADWINYLDGMTFFASISSVWLLARKKKQGFTMLIINYLIIICITSGVGIWSQTAATAFGLVTAVYGYLNWSYNYNLDKDPNSIYKIKK